MFFICIQALCQIKQLYGVSGIKLVNELPNRPTKPSKPFAQSYWQLENSYWWLKAVVSDVVL